MRRCLFLFFVLLDLLANVPARATEEAARDTAPTASQRSVTKPHLGIFTDPEGNTGVGTTAPRATLDVPGEVKIGSTGAPCTKAIGGAIRYAPGDSVSKPGSPDAGAHLQLCDGTGWRNVSLDKAQ